jgi:hypothetical protein
MLDFHQYPSLTASLHYFHPMFTTFLTQPATMPPLPSVTVRIETLPWSIIVLPSQPDAPDAYVSAWDVLEAIHRQLGEVVTPGELGELPSEEMRSLVWAVFQHRAWTSPDPWTREIELRAGPRCIDMLLGYTRFLGLTISGDGEHLVLGVC